MSEYELDKYYRRLFKKYGDSVCSAQWKDRASQEVRFKYLLEIGDCSNLSVLDFGCGTGYFLDYIQRCGIEVNYTGVELVEEMIQCARQKHKRGKFVKWEEAKLKYYDFSFICGVFNNKVSNNRDYYKRIIKDIYSVTKIGMAFNMLSTYVDYYDNSLFYEEPEEVFSFIKSEVSDFVTLRHDYQVKVGVLPYEFTVYVYRNGFNYV